MPLKLDPIESGIVLSSYKSAAWLFHITTTAPVSYYYSLGFDKSWGGQSYTANILDQSFSGIRMARASTEFGLVTPDELLFSVTNPSNTLTDTDFNGASVVVRLVVSDGTNEKELMAWKFYVKRCLGQHQQLDFHCDDFLWQYLRGQWPNTALVKELWPEDTSLIDDGTCVPVILGTAYIPLRSCFIFDAISVADTTISAVASASGSRCKFSDSASGFGSIEIGRVITVTGFTDGNNNGTFTVLNADADDIEVAVGAGLVTEAAGDSVTVTQGSRPYLLGPSAPTFTITEVRTPREYGKKSAWTSGSYTFTQMTKQGEDGDNYKLFNAIIADIDNDGTADAPGLWRSGDRFLDALVKFSQSVTSGTTNPADWLEYILEDMGIASADIDTGAGSTFADFESICGGAAEMWDGIEWDGIDWESGTGVALAFNGGFWQKQSRESVIAKLLVCSHATLYNNEQLEVHRKNSVSRMLITKDYVLAPDERSPGIFERSGIERDELSDTCFVKYTPSGDPQDAGVQYPVTAKGVRSSVSSDVLDVPFVSDSQNVQRIAKLWAQEKYLPVETIRFDASHELISLRPDDFITINHADLGGTYKVRIDAMDIRPDLSVGMECTRFSDDIDNFEDLSPSAITVKSDDTAKLWETVVGGPLSGENLGQSRIEIFSRPNLIVGPNSWDGEFTSIQDALNQLAQTRHNGIYIQNGVYAHTGPIYLPDRDIDITGESMGGVDLRNNAGDELFILYNLTSLIRFFNFYVNSQNVGNTSDALFKIYGDVVANNTSKVHIERVKFALKDSGTWAQTTGDKAVYANIGDGWLKVIDCVAEDGSYLVYADEYEKVILRGNQTEDTKRGDFYTEDVDDFSITDHIAKNFNYRVVRVYDTSTNYRGIIDHVNGVGKNISGGTFQHGIYVSYVDNLQCNHNILKMAHAGTNSGDSITIGIVVQDCNNAQVRGNSVDIDVSDVKAAYGLLLGDMADSVISGNSVKVDNDDTTVNHYGIDCSNVDRCVIGQNNVNMVNNDAKDIGIALGSTSDNNQGGDNITYNCGTGISDAGAGNAVTGKDV